MIKNILTFNKIVIFTHVLVNPSISVLQDISKYDNGIGPLDFKSLKLISFPGGQQYGAISPCEMNEFSTECEEWEDENGPYIKGKYMVNSNDRTKGR